MKAFYFFILLFFSLGFNTLSQKQINYDHKTIEKEVKKVFGAEQFDKNQFPISNNHTLQGKFFSLNIPETKYLYVGRVKSCRAGGCSIDTKKGGTSEYFDYFILFNEKAEVKGIKIFNYAASHGHEVTSKGWLKQYIGHESSKQLEVGTEIDSISGATISVYALTSDVKEKTGILKQVLDEKNNNSSKLSSNTAYH